MGKALLILTARLFRSGLANGMGYPTRAIKNGMRGPASRFQLRKLVHLLLPNATRNGTAGAALSERGDPFGADGALRTCRARGIQPKTGSISRMDL